MTDRGWLTRNLEPMLALLDAKARASLAQAAQVVPLPV